MGFGKRKPAAAQLTGLDSRALLQHVSAEVMAEGLQCKGGMNLDMPKKLVGVSGTSRSEPYRLLFDSLSQLYPLEFRQVPSQDCGVLDALLVLDGDVAAGLAAAAAGVPSYVVVAGDSLVQNAPACEVRFGMSRSLDDYLRGQVMVDRDVNAFCSLSVQVGDEVLASRGGFPVWLSRPTLRVACQLVGASPPPLQKGEFMFQHLNGSRFLRLLPLLHFLRQLVQDVDWQSAAPCACFVFDDPSLYWPSYGFLNYRLLAEHATTHGYFVSIATVPLDTWWVNSTVAATFRSYSPRLSLLIHGNNHTSRELLSLKNGVSHLALAAQAMRRMARLQQKYQIDFLRIMEAPHGVFASGIVDHLLELGYEAALGTTEQLVQYNPDTPWPMTIGMDRSEMLGRGLPVIPRIRMSPDWKNEVLLAAFLRQPILVVGHHQDAVEQFKALADIARVVHSLEGVVWASPLEIARSNYKELRRGDVLALKSYARWIHVAVPDGVKEVYFYRPWLKGPEDRGMLIVKSAGHELFNGVGTGLVGPIRVEAPGVLEFCSPAANPIDYRLLRAPGPRCWPVVRKLLMEVRDRSAPFRYRAVGPFHHDL